MILLMSFVAVSILLHITPVRLEHRFAGLDLVEGLYGDVVLGDALGGDLDPVGVLGCRF